jgi:lysozyme family protein
VGPTTGRALGLPFWGPAPLPSAGPGPSIIAGPSSPPPPVVRDAYGVVVNTSKVYSDIRIEYEQIFATCVVQDKNGEIASIAERIAESRQRYSDFVSGYAGQAASGMPWYFVALVHAMESSGDVGRFRTHLHNGDPLTRPTVQIPKNRPRTTGFPFSWEESARDALALQKLDQQTDWTLPRMLFYFEKFNGFGPRGKGHATAYLWSYSNQYIKGKYEQPGVSAILKQLVDVGAVSI